MLSITRERPSSESEQANEKTSGGWVLVRLDQHDRLPSVIPHAMAVAFGLNRKVRLIEVIASKKSSAAPIDPVEWDLKKREAQLHLQKLASIYADDYGPIDTRVVERFSPDDVGECGGAVPPVLSFGRHGSELPWHLDIANRKMLEQRCSSILMVPDVPQPPQLVRYQRILVPLDGSSRGESALPMAIAIARSHGAELCIVHATPEAAFTRNGPLEAEALELETRLHERNRRVATEYLSQMRTRCQSSGASVTTRLVNHGEVRRRIVDLARTLQADLIVMTAHGVGGHGDVLSGSVASFILEHSPLPVLMVGSDSGRAQKHLFSEARTQGVRQPGDLVGIG